MRIPAVHCDRGCNIIRFFIHHLRVHLKVVPWDYDLTSEEFEGLFISDGPGNPEASEATIRHLHKVTEGRPSLPIFGIGRPR